jgi:hypothetical protein
MCCVRSFDEELTEDLAAADIISAGDTQMCRKKIKVRLIKVRLTKNLNPISSVQNVACRSIGANMLKPEIVSGHPYDTPTAPVDALTMIITRGKFKSRFNRV